MLMKPGTIIAGVTVLAALVRVAVVLHYSSQPTPEALLPDERQYLDMAAGLAAGQGLRDELGFRATRMPLYPAFLALLRADPQRRLPALLVQAALAAAAAGCAAALAMAVARESNMAGAAGSAEHVALATGLIVACDPFLVYAARFALTDMLFTAALSAALLGAWPLARAGAPAWRWAACGGLFALCVYLRPEALALMGLWSIWILWRRGADRWCAAGIGAVAVIVILALWPWAARNQREIGHRTWLTHRLGISLYDGLGPQATGASDLGAIKQAPEVVGLNEVQWDRYFVRASWAAVRSDPWRAVRLAWIKLGRTWRPWPAAAGHEDWRFKVIGGLWTGGILLSATAGAARLRRHPALIAGLLLPAVYFTVLHMIFVGSVRYRLPAMPMIEVLSGIAIAAWLSSLWRKRSV
jgi:hypothetical protein